MINTSEILTSDEGLTTSETRRYARHLSIPEVGKAGQERLKRSGVLVIGAGGLGSPALQYLAAAGIGRIGIVDADRVESSNLQRQVLYTEADTGYSKAQRAAERLRAMNADITIDVHEQVFDNQSAEALAAPYDVIIDGTDNFPTRYLSNDLAVLTSKPNVYGSIQIFEGQVSVFAPHLGGPCYRCMFPEPPPPGAVPTCAEAGVLGVLPGIVGSLQALEAIKLILGLGQPLIGRLLVFNALEMRFRPFPLKRDPQCPVCGEAPIIRDVRKVDYPAFCGIHPPAADPGNITPRELAARLKTGRALQLVDVREDFERDICALPGAIPLPLGQVSARLGELDAARETVVFCKSGRRSQTAMNQMLQGGFKDIRNLEGGILAWIRDVDPSLSSY
jgi:molybdopterin/thiamine biosynthesis adenylyltransferase/rhodanese-related sulfurtransferase